MKRRKKGVWLENTRKKRDEEKTENGKKRTSIAVSSEKDNAYYAWKPLFCNWE